MAQTPVTSGSRKIILKAPLSGPLVPIEQVPDPVFAQKMVGDGISIDPVDQFLLAPCDGDILQLHSAGHALTMRVEGGVEIMMHIGLDTVALNGEGFRPRVQTGDSVRCGDVLIEFDADYIATHASSLLTQIVVTNSELVSRFDPCSGVVSAGQDDVLHLWLGQPPDSESESPPATEAPSPEQPATRPRPVAPRPQKTGITLRSEEISISNKFGLHARPSAVLASLAKTFVADIRLERGGDSVDAKSVVGIMELEVGFRDRIKLVAQGEDAGEALGKLVPLLEEGLGEADLPSSQVPASDAGVETTRPSQPRLADNADEFRGMPASEGLAIGEIFQLRHEQLNIEEVGRNPHDEQRLLDQALAEAGAQLEALQSRVRREAGADKAAIFSAHKELLDDPCLLDHALAAIAEGKSAAWAWQQTIESHASLLAELKNPVLAERATDLRDLGRRVLRLLLGNNPAEQHALPPNSILIAEELSPSIIANLDRDKVLGFCTVLGSASSHVAILARSLDLPAIANVDSRVLSLADGTPAVLDGEAGILRVNPSAEKLQQAQQNLQSSSGVKQQNLHRAHEEAISLDGTRIEVAANIGKLDDIRQAVGQGAEGVGLLRTEFLFLHRQQAPSEDEQLRFYQDIAAFLGPDQLLVIRTLDVGGDKPLVYLPIPREANPFLGERGIRFTLDRPDCLRQQIRAILRASERNRVAIMLPMVSTLDELRQARTLVDEEQQALGVGPIPLGIMVEVPAAALMAKQFAREADFFSIGSNDLAQYTLAVDRDHPRLAATLDSLNPAVLRMIATTVDSAKGSDTWVSICGTVASDPHALPFLLGLGLTRLSCSAPAIPAVKAGIRLLDIEECRELAQRALEQDSAEAVRALWQER